MAPKGFREMLQGCLALIHTATPVEISMDGKPPPNEEEVQRMQISPAVDGTVALLRAAEEAGVKKVVLTSSTSAMRASNPPPRVLDETCWSDESYLQQTLFTKWSACYNLAKTWQEREARRLAESSQFKLITINTAVLVGPSLTPQLNFGQKVLLNLIQGHGTGHDMCQANTVPDVYKGWVDVREVADAHVLALESDGAEGRY